MLSSKERMNNRDPKVPFPHDVLFWPVLFLIPQFVRPNHVTVFRMILTPIVLITLFIENWAIGVPLFVFACFTDALDGSMARLRKQVTDWGTFYDPIADKMLIGSVVLLIVIRYVNPVIAIGIIVVELMIMVGGWYRRRRKNFQPANIWGKIKMILEFLGVLFLLISLWSGVDLFVDLSQGTLVLAIIFAIVSLLTYSL